MKHIRIKELKRADVLGTNLYCDRIMHSCEIICKHLNSIKKKYTRKQLSKSNELILYDAYIQIRDVQGMVNVVKCG